MLRKVPIGISLLGCGTVTRPGRCGCLNCRWLPFWATCAPACGFKAPDHLPTVHEVCIYTHFDAHPRRDLGPLIAGFYWGPLYGAVFADLLGLGPFWRFPGFFCGLRSLGWVLMQALVAPWLRAREAG